MMTQTLQAKNQHAKNHLEDHQDLATQVKSLEKSSQTVTAQVATGVESHGQVDPKDHKSG